MTEPNPETPNEWSRCPVGCLSDLSTRLRWKTTRRRVARVAAGTGLVAMLVAAVWLIPRGVAPAGAVDEVAKITCPECLDLAPDYLARRLSEEKRQAIERHLSRCGHCAEQYAAMEPNPEASAARPGPVMEFERLASAR